MLREVFSVLSLFIAGCLAAHGPAWSYTKNNTDPNNWATNIPVMCSGLYQSPINLETDTATYLGSETKFVVEISRNASSTSGTFEVVNNGHSLQVNIPEAAWRITLNKEAKDFYNVRQFHFHWGSTNTKGSEHTLDSARFPLEMHIVAYSSMYANVNVAISSPGGLTVIGVFFQPTTDQSKSSLSKMGNLLSVIGNLRNTSSTAQVNAFSPDVLLPQNKDEFFRYQGSLTTPPCTENVQWTVMRHALRVTDADLEKLRSLRFGNNEVDTQMQDNFRPVQPLNPSGVAQPRVLYKSWSSASSRLAASVFAIILEVTLSTFSN